MSDASPSSSARQSPRRLRLEDIPGWAGPGSVTEDAVYDTFVAWVEESGIRLYPAQEVRPVGRPLAG